MDLLSNLLSPQAVVSNQAHVVQYSPRYRLAFTLMNEDAADGRVVPGWDIRAAISRE